MWTTTGEISDDEDDNFQAPSHSKKRQQNAKAGKTVIEISSDEDTDDDNSMNVESIISDDDQELPNIELKNKTVERDNLISKIFPARNPTNNSNTASTSKVKQTFLNDFKYIPKNVFKIPPEVLPPPKPSHKKMIGGVEVDFPVPPYGAQIALMSKVIESINKGFNCLLESPTGSGKTLALLCGALAWQSHERKRVNAILAQQLQNVYPTADELDNLVEVASSSSATAGPMDPDKLFSKQTFGNKSIYDKLEETQAGFKRQEPLSENDAEAGLVSIHKKRRLEDDPPSTSWRNQNPASANPMEQNAQTLRVPKIYYGARTHKQIQQVVKEFSSTVYAKEAKMSVLSSREYSCIREFDRSLYASKNDMCRECVIKVSSRRDQSTNCIYFENRKELNHKTLPPAFDLEDLVAAGKEKRACPYYAARIMATGAQIIFCPYNYLIDPGIRESLQIDLQDEIVILDEAHNIEDICRDAATFTITRDQINSAFKELDKLTEYAYANQDISSDISILVKSLRNWSDWFNNQMPLLSNQPVVNNESVYIWKVENFAETLSNHNIGLQQHVEFRYAVETFCRKLRDDPATLYGVSQSTGNLLEQMGLMLCYLFSDNGKNLDDYKPILIKTLQSSTENVPNAAGWRSTHYDQQVQSESVSLRVLCLHGGAVFAGVCRARSVLLASGTLTPLHSLRSELAATFCRVLSVAHVISSDRVWIGSLTTCPNGRPLECKSAATNQTDVQDAIGDTILWACQVTPNGVLCFVPSYQLMYKLNKRWRETGLWRKLNDTKHVFMESRNVKDHGDIMDDYYKYVGTEKGALLLAVYRGKVSEGMDFKDHQARIVITVGIPYPNTFDMSVKEKMSYNDRHVTDKQLLPSGEWLRVQAYRALNQAAGRCVRHRRDWGAVLLVDTRYSQSYYTQHLSAWIRGMLGNNHHTFQSLVNSENSLESFMKNMKILEQNEDC